MHFLVHLQTKLTPYIFLKSYTYIDYILKYFLPVFIGIL